MIMCIKVVYTNKVATGICVSDGTQWTFPTPDVDGSASWKLRHTDWQPTKEERLLLAAILDSYRELVYAPNQQKITLVTKGIKAGMNLT